MAHILYPKTNIIEFLEFGKNNTWKSRNAMRQTINLIAMEDLFEAG